jgi:hypothetical protein
MFNGAKGSGSGDGLTYTSISLPKDTAIVWIPPVDFNPAYNWSRVLSGENGALPLPGNVVDQMGHMPGVVSQVPDVAECSPGYLFGAPTAKIVVSELTDSSTTTIYKGGAYSETTTPYQSNPGTTTEIPTAPKTSSPQESPNPPSPSYTSPNTPSVTTPIGNTAPGGSSAPGIITIGTVPITQQPSSVYVISSKTLSPGGSPIEVSGTTYSLAPSATAIIVNGVTSNIPQASPFPAYPAVTTAIAGFVGPSQTLVAGGQSIVVSGTTYSLVSSGNAIVVNGHTSTLSSGAQVIAIGSQTFTYNPSASSVLVINGQTLVPGGSAITVSGETISLPASGTNVVVVSAGKTTSKGLGGYIISGLAGPGTQTRAPAAFTGSAVRGLSMPWIWSMIWAAGLSGLFWPLFDA